MQFQMRHPYAATAVVVLLLLGSVDWTSHSIGGTPRAESYYGLFRGHIVCGYYGGEDQSLIPIFRPWDNELHFPTLGRKLEWGRGSFPTIPHFEAAIPLYLLLLALVVWVTFIEFKRRKV